MTENGAESRVDASGVAAVVVLYEPTAVVADNIASFADQVATVFVVDNSTTPHRAAIELVESLDNVVPISNGANIGIASALNVGVRAARDAGFEWVLTMDQDSTATPGMVEALLSCAVADPARVGLVSPVHHQVGGEPRTVAPGCHEVLTAMTSGNIVSVSALDRVGWFMDDLFIDQVDNEICLRFSRAGLRVLESGDADLVHRVGDVRKHRFPYPAYSSNHSPVRRYYITRNRLVVGRMYAADYPQFWRFERAQMLKELVKIVLYEREKGRKLAMMWRGWRDYRAGRMGPYSER
jgi:rhamnosyltransferase